MNTDNLSILDACLMRHALRAYIGTAKRDRRLRPDMRRLLAKVSSEDAPGDDRQPTVKPVEAEAVRGPADRQRAQPGGG